MTDEIEKKDLSALMKESWDFFTKRWIILFKISIFVGILAILIFPLLSFLISSYQLLKKNPELLFSFKVILAGGILSFTVFCLFIFVLSIDRLMKVTIMDTLWEKPEEKYYLNFFKALKEVWPKMRELYNAQLLAWIIILLGFLLFFLPGVICLIWFSFVPYEVILRGKTGKEALYSSKNITSHDLAKFVGNMLVMIGIMIFINTGLSGFFKLIFSLSTTLASFGELVATIIFNILSLWLTVFHFSLYKELEKRYLLAQGVPVPQPEESVLRQAGEETKDL